MTFNAKIYVSVLLALGFCVLASTFAHASPVDARFAAYFALSVFASVLKVGMPALAGSMSFNFLFVLIAIIDLGMPQALLIGTASILIESLWRAKQKPRPLEILFSLSSVALSVYCTDAVFHSEYLIGLGFNLPARLAVATTVFFIVNTFPVCAVTSLAERAPLLPIWREQYFWSFPYYALGGVLAFAFRMETMALGWETSLLTIPVAQLLYRTYSLYLARLEDSKEHAEELASLHMRTIEALALAIEAKDDTTHEHLQRVQVYAVEIGKELGLTEDELEALRAAAVLHDIGKLAVPEYIISKPGKLTPEEFEKMKVHPIVGAEILDQVQFPYPVVPIVRAHHEKWNGTGYPMGLRGNDIPIGARILSAVDALDALASDRQYRRALPLDEAMGKVERESGSSFDPAVVVALKRNYVALEKRAQTQKATTSKLSTGVKVERGDAPAAGFETTRAALPRSNDQTPADALDGVMSARKDMQLLFDIGESPEHPLGFQEMMSVLAVRLKRVAPVDALALYLIRDDKLLPEFVTGDNCRLFASLEIPVGQGLSGWVAENRKPIMNGNPSVEPGYLNDPNVFSTLRSALSVPLEIDGTIIGVLTVYHEDRDAYTKDHLKLLETLAPKLGHSIEQTLRAGELAPSESAGFDVLTGLPQARALFLHLESELTRCKRLNIGLAVIVCSVAGIKKLNERRGRLEGDKAIQAMAGILKSDCREFEYVARMGASEFVLVLPGMRRDALPAKTARIANLTAMKKGSEQVSVIMGEAFFPDDGTDADELIAAADRRMLQVKQTRIPPQAARSAANWLQ